MKKALDWSNYEDQGMGDAYADIPKHGEDFAKAISVCIRSGVCQKPDNRGVMCPSFRLNDDPQLSPGGRVQLFKSLLNADETRFISDKSLAASMDQCVSCKGCKRECENNVDMAAIKAEYLAQKRQARHKSFRSWLFAEFPFLLYKYPVIGSLIKLRNRSSLLAKLGHHLLGINGSIPMPEPADTPYQPVNDTSDSVVNDESNPISVVLLVDSFTALFHPQLADDAQAILKAANYPVTIVHPGSEIPGKTKSEKALLDSGRSLFSQGYIERAKQQAEDLLTQLSPYLKENVRIVGLEPSALLMLRDEFLMLGLGEKAEQLAKQTLLFEEFVSRELVAGRFKAPFKPYTENNDILVHGHCHQKAVGAMKSMRKALRLIPDLPFTFIEASCCGMAGSWGLEAEHTLESQQMAKQALLPALENKPEATVVCNGFSCSHQIYALTGRKPLNLVSLLARHI
ncbi:ferredoxin [Vibrio albus]|uniref:Ferredoxin n=1 Tax=Vibrio albus TaxID=2200953 RepID=A0A2U3B9B2_9VIBR|nr:(Fe-S)-binding protein [Vibrio albus]PWI33361.1 ferredoxin [Vibrio albus]